MAFKHAEVRIPQALLWGVFLIVIIFVAVQLLYFIISTKQSLHDQFEVLDKEVHQRQHKWMEREAERSSRQVEFVLSRSEIHLKEKAKLNVKQAISVANSLYHRFKNDYSDEQLQSLIKETLRPLTFFNGRGYIFITHLGGTIELNPPRPELEGSKHEDNPWLKRLIQQSHEAVDNPQKSGFFEYKFPTPSDPIHQTSEKISYLELFEPLGWVIGSGDYIKETQKDLKLEELERLGNIRFGGNGHISVVHIDGTILKSLGWEELEGLPLNELPANAATTVNAILTKAKQGEGIIEYQWKQPQTGKFAHKHSYVKPIPNSNWVLVSGFYDVDLLRLVEDRRQALDKRYLAERSNLTWSVSLLSALALLMVFFYTRWMTKRFQACQVEMDSYESDLRHYTEALEISERIVSSANEGILVTDADNKIVLANEAVLKITGYSRDELVGRSPNVLSSGRHSEYFYKKLWQSLSDKGYWVGEIWNRRKDGEIYPEWLNLSLYKDEAGNVVNHIATFADITDRKRDQERLSYLAHFDPLTDLPNRRLLIDRLNQQMHTAQRNAKERVAVMFVDLDHFKNVNDTLGHGIGDQVLVEIASRIKECLSEEDTLSRVGGDEFAILIKDGDDIFAKAGHAALRVLEVASQPVVIEHEEIILSASIGIAVSPDDGSTSEQLMKHADTALFHAKAQGRKNFLFFTKTMNVAINARLDMEKQIRKALKEQQFKLYYQPQINVKTGKLDGVEALIRWPKDNGSFVPPDQFIPVAEQTGQIIDIGDWVLETALKQIHEWKVDGHNITVSVNISSSQLRANHLKAKLDKLLSAYKISPSQLIFEVTETALIEDLDKALAILEKLQSCGIGLSLDDFGTGYSSLTLLKRASVNELKIDRSFIDGLPVEPEDIAITTSLVSAAHHLGIEVVAEGVETQDQLQFLQGIGCDKTQGYYYSPAIDADALREKYFS